MEVLATACSLSATELADVRARYAKAADTYTAMADIHDERAVIRLYGDQSALRTLLDEMVQRESGCCAFFRFEVEEMDGGLRVELTAPGADQPATLLRAAVDAFFPTARPVTPAQ